MKNDGGEIFVFKMVEFYWTGEETDAYSNDAIGRKTERVSRFR